MASSIALTEARTVHSRARTAWLSMAERRDRSLTPKHYLDYLNAWWDGAQSRNPEFYRNRPDEQQMLETYVPWTDNDDEVMESLDRVVRELDKFALPRKQVYRGS